MVCYTFAEMNSMHPVKLLFALLLFLTSQLSGQPGLKEFKIQRNIPVSGNGSWDYLALDSKSQRIFLSHDSCVQVIDLKTGKQVGRIDHTPGVHGIALAPEFGKGFISAGAVDSVMVFDLKTYEVTNTIHAGKNPDAILFDPYSKRVFVFNGESKSCTVILAENDDILSNFPLRGKPEFAVSDNAGTIYVNIENQSTIMGFDAKTYDFKGLFPLGPGREPTGLAIDLQNSLLFAGCSGTNELVVVNIESGETVATLPIGWHCDGVTFMPATHEIFTSNGEGTITAIRQNSPDKYSKEQTVITKRGARTITSDDDSGRLYVPVAEYDYDKKEFIPDSFQLLVVSR